MEVTHSKIKDCFLIKPLVRTDERGYFMESFNERDFAAATGMSVHFVQDNQSRSTKGVLRGLHYQTGDHAQSKLVRVFSGQVLDVVVDIRPESPTFGQHISAILSDENQFQMFIPKGCAHGFLVLSDEATFFYKCDNFYNREYEGGIIYDDPAIGIDWQFEKGQLIISEKDRFLPTLRHAKKVW